MNVNFDEFFEQREATVQRLRELGARHSFDQAEIQELLNITAAVVGSLTTDGVVHSDNTGLYVTSRHGVNQYTTTRLGNGYLTREEPIPAPVVEPPEEPLARADSVGSPSSPFAIPSWLQPKSWFKRSK